MASSYAVWTRFGLKDGMTKGFKKMSKSATGFGSVLKGILSANAIQAGFRKLREGISSFVTEASKIEDAVAGFTPLMGGVEKATKLVDRLNQEAATTPFQFEGISSVAKQLLPVMNGSIERTADTFRMLGDTAGGNIQKLDSITRGYTKALLKGKPDMEALNMIAEAGVPIFSEMANTMGIAQEQLFVLSKQGKLTNNDLTKTFQNMTKEGGIFFRGMEIASQTFTGRMSTLKDNIALTAGAIGSTFMDVLKDGTDQLIKIASGVREWVVANKALIKTKVNQFITGIKNTFQKLQPLFQRVFNVAKNLVSSVFELGKVLFNLGKSIYDVLEQTGVLNFLFGVFESVAGFVSDSIKGISKAIEFLTPVLRIILPILAAWIAYQTILNVVLTANPIGLIIVAIGALVLAIGWLIENWDKVIAGFQFFAGKVADSVMFVVGEIGDFFGFLGERIQAIINIFRLLGEVILGTVMKAFEEMWKFVEPIVKGISDFVGGVGDFFGGAIQGVGDFFGGIGQGIGDFFTGGGSQTAPNQSEVEARQAIQFEGKLNIAGAPAGSTFNQNMIGAPPLRYEMIGAQ